MKKLPLALLILAAPAFDAAESDGAGAAFPQ